MINKISFKLFGVALAGTLALTSCIQEFEPQSGTVTGEQASNAPGAYDNFVNAITSNISGKFVFSGSNYQQPNDFGYSALYLRRDVMGQDIVAFNNNWFSTSYQCGVGLLYTTPSPRSSSACMKASSG